MHEYGNSQALSVTFPHSHGGKYVVSEFGRKIDHIPEILIEGTPLGKAGSREKIAEAIRSAYKEPEGSGPFSDLQRRHNAYSRLGFIQEPQQGPSNIL